MRSRLSLVALRHALRMGIRMVGMGSGLIWLLCLLGFSRIIARRRLTKTCVFHSPFLGSHYSVGSCLIHMHIQFIYLSDQHLYSKRWESLIASRDNVDIVEILTWNDYGESHYIGPIKGSQPNSQAWVDGLNHTGGTIHSPHYICLQDIDGGDGRRMARHDKILRNRF
jgi:Glycosyl hydrolase family 71